MTKSFFLAKLATQFERCKAPEYLADISEFLDGFTEDQLTKVWTEFADNYALASAPRRAHFVAAAKAVGVSKPGVASSSAEWEYVCYVCCARYPIGAYKCPSCGNRERYALIRPGAYFDRAHAAEVLEKNPMGPHPTLGVKTATPNPKMVSAIGRVLGGRE